MAKRGKKSTQTAAADPVTIQYNSTTIGTLADSGKVTLKCADKRMLSDVEINYGVENYAPSAVTSTGDVTVTYGEETIGTLSDSGTLTLATAGCRVPGDIYVNYTKPAGGLEANEINITVGNFDTEGETIPIESDIIHFVALDDGVPISVFELAVRPNREYTYYGIQGAERTPDGMIYHFFFSIKWPVDNLFNVFVNNTQIPFDNGYAFEVTDTTPIVGRTFNVTFTPKG